MTDHLHPDNEPSPEVTLASASVDGALTPDELTAALASSEVQALHATFAEVRTQLHDVPSAADEVRETALAAALAEFDAMHTPALAAAAAFSATAPVIDLASRRRWPTRLLAVAAGVALVGIAGIAAFGNRGDDAKDAGLAKESTAQISGVAGGAPATIGAINGAADARLPIEDPQQLRDLASPTSTPMAAPSTDGSGTADTTVSAAGDQTRSSMLGSECLSDHQVLLAPITYQGTLGYAVRDTVTGVTQAIDEQCNVLVEVGP